LKNIVPQNYSARIKVIRQKLGLTQMRLAELMGVSFASVNRWENGQSRPSSLAWRKIERVEVLGYDGLVESSPTASIYEPSPVSGISVQNASVSLLSTRAEREVLTTSVATPIKNGIRSLLPDTESVFSSGQSEEMYMAGLYIREMLVRGLIQRILIIVPNEMLPMWQRELKTQFGLSFKAVVGVTAAEENPFKEQDSDFVITSLELFADDTVFALLRESDVMPYDVTILDEPSSDGGSGNGGKRSGNTARRRQVADAFAGIHMKDHRHQLPWRARHLLLLTAGMQRNFVD
jgi:transcriptional regulator with XRE-family HTH domain